MNTETNHTLYSCGCCKQQLPRESFYFNKRTQTPENYCKVCRKTNSSKHRAAERYAAQSENRPASYPVITQIKDPQVRIELIRHALQKVKESIGRKQKRDRDIAKEEWVDNQ